VQEERKRTTRRKREERKEKRKREKNKFEKIFNSYFGGGIKLKDNLRRLLKNIFSKN
jgi:hypothetical protein